MNTQLSDSQLLQLYREGQAEAISTLLERHTLRIRNYIRMMVKDHDVAEDLLQEVLIKCVRMIDNDRYTDSGKMLSWMLRIAHNMTIDHFRANKSHAVVNESEAGYNIMDVQRESESAVDVKIIAGETEHQVRKLVDQLPEDQREVVELRYFSGLSFREIAEQTDVSINTSLGRMRYALINLRKLIKDHKLALA